MISAEILIYNCIYNSQSSLNGIREAQGGWAGSAKLLFGAAYTLTCATASFLVKAQKARKPLTAMHINAVML